MNNNNSKQGGNKYQDLQIYIPTNLGYKEKQGKGIAE